ncbi:MAG: hypothetical protein FJ360_03425 [Thaumarchaeota archaeon]|jgi:hypothetical protein|nr:hypothetical protein [Nitrososphaerota archaeon]
MQYFVALKIGQKRVQAARDLLNKFVNGKAMPALALRDNKTNVWEPVGEENLYAVVDESSGFVLTDTSGYLLVLCDKNGISKALIQGLNKEQKDQTVKMLEAENIPQYKGKVSLPV